jgi:hypothetical protein
LFQAYGATAGGLPLVELDRPDGSTLARFEAFENSFRGGVRATVGEFDGNPNTVELVATPGAGGGSNVKVFAVNITTGSVSEYASFFAFEPAYRGGLFVAVGSVAANGRDQIVVGADAGGGPRVRTFDLINGNATQIDGPLGNFFAFEDTFRGGVRVAAGELDGNTADGAELVVAAGYFGAPRITVLRSDGAVLADYLAFSPTYTGGVFVGFNSTGNFQASATTDGNDFSQRNAALNLAAIPPLPPVVQSTSVGTNASSVFGTTSFPSQFGGTTSIGGTPITNVGGVISVGGVAITNVGGTPNFTSTTFGTPGFGTVGGTGPASPGTTLTTNVGGTPNFSSGPLISNVGGVPGFNSSTIGTQLNFGTPGNFIPFPTFATPILVG